MKNPIKHNGQFLKDIATVHVKGSWLYVCSYVCRVIRLTLKVNTRPIFLCKACIMLVNILYCQDYAHENLSNSKIIVTKIVIYYSQNYANILGSGVCT